MSYLVLVVLSLLWLGFFLPGLLQARRMSSPYDSAATFQQSLTRISTRRPVMPGDAATSRAPQRRTSRRQIARQREVLAVLAAAAAGSVVLAVAFAGAVRLLPLPAVGALIAYVAMLRLRVVRGHVSSARPPRDVPPTAPVQLETEVVQTVRRRHGEPTPQLERIAG